MDETAEITGRMSNLEEQIRRTQDAIFTLQQSLTGLEHDYADAERELADMTNPELALEREGQRNFLEAI